MQPEPRESYKGPQRPPANAVHVLAVLSQAAFPVPYSTIAEAIEREPGSVLLALLELEALGVVQSRALYGGGVLYAVARGEQWRATW